ncbi:MAG: thioesterase family protein [Salinibacter sp.]
MAPPLPDTARHLHTARISVRWGDMDAAGHVNNSRFFRYFEEARVRWLQATGDEAVGADSGPVLAHASCDFERPVRHPATLLVAVHAEPPGHSSLRTHYIARLDGSGDIVATGEATIVWVDAESGAPVPLPDLGI